MYTTIEADIKNGQVLGAEAAKLPSQAHVLITLLNSLPGKKAVFGCAQGQIEMSADFNDSLDDFADYM